MIRALPIFGLFRHGRVESAFSAAPLVLTNPWDELRDREPGNKPAAVRAHWILAADDRGRRLKLSWTTVDEERRRS